MNKQSKPKICPYCGKRVEKLTKDHIVSRGLFVQPYPDNLPTVRVCYPCNQEKGYNEDYLRDFLILNMEAGSSTIARTLVDTTLTRSIQSKEHGNTSKVAHAVATQSRLVALTTQRGIIWGHAYQVPIERERIRAVITAMVKGFYFKKFGKILPETHTVNMVWISSEKVPVSWDMPSLKGAQRKNLGQVFSYQYLATEDKLITTWQLLFYQSILFQIVTYPPEFTPSIDLSKVRF